MVHLVIRILVELTINVRVRGYLESIMENLDDNLPEVPDLRPYFPRAFST